MDKPNQELNKVRSELKNGGNRATIDLFISLLDERLKQKREMGDDSRGDDTLINQGGIQEIKFLKTLLKLDA